MAVSLLDSGIINAISVNVNDAGTDLSYSSLGCTETIFKAVPDKDHVAIRVKRLIAEKAGMGFKAIHDDFLIEDLGLDSVDMVELSMQIEEEFDVDASNSMRIEGWANITTVRQAPPYPPSPGLDLQLENRHELL